MDSLNTPDPLILLLNEIDILLAQMRLFELYVKQAQAKATYETTLGYERQQAELATMREELAESERSRAASQAAAGLTEQNLLQCLQTVESQLNQKQSQLEQCDAELKDEQARSATLRAQIDELQVARDQAERMIRDSADAYRRLETESRDLRRCLDELQQTVHEQQIAWQASQRDWQVEIATVRQQLEETVAAAQTAESQLEQKQQLIAFRDEELREAVERAKALEQRAVDLENANQMAADHVCALELTGRVYEQEINNLRQEIDIRERALFERQEAVTAVELALHAKIQTLQQELARQRQQINERNTELQLQRSEIARLHEAIEQQNSAAASESAARQNAEDASSTFEAENHELRRRLDEQRILAELANEEIERLRATLPLIENEKNEKERLRHEFEQNWRQATALNEDLKTRLRAVEEVNAAAARTTEEKEAALAAQQTHWDAIGQKLRNEIAELRGQLHEHEIIATQAREELGRIHSENAALGDQNRRSEQLRRELDQHWQIVAADHQQLQADLQQKNKQLEASLSEARALQSQSQTRLRELQLQLTENQLISDTRGTEINNLKAEVARLTLQLMESDESKTQLQKQFELAIDSGQKQFQSEISALRDDSQLKQQALINELSKERERAVVLTEQLSESERRVRALANEIDERRKELQTITAESANLNLRLDQLEKLYQSEHASAEQDKAQVQLHFAAELAAVRQELQQKSSLAAQQQATLESLATAHKDQIEHFELEVAELQNRIANRDLDLEKSQSQARLFERRIEELSTEQQQGESRNHDRAAQIKEQYELRIAELEKQLSYKDTELQERGLSQAQREQALRQEIERLIHEAQEKNQILQSRNDELVRVKAALDPLQDRVSEMESAATGMASAAAAESERMHGEFQAQLALLQAELSQKDWALEEREALVQTVEQNYRQQIDTLREQLKKDTSPESRLNGEFVMGEVKANQGQEPQFEAAKDVNGNSGELYHSGQQRRWHSGFGWKRRWKSSETR